jgi:hypothetical protein
MGTPIEGAYFEWLCAKVSPVGLRDKSYSQLFKILHETEFVWLILGDDNRAQDGIDLRDVFLREALIEPDDDAWYNVMCSVLEMLVAFSFKADFQTDDGVREWFWEFMDNLHLTDFHDDCMDYEAVDDILYRFIWRLYEQDGSEGGLFPLPELTHDQRKVEIWYQFSEYIIQNDRLP